MSFKGALNPKPLKESSDNAPLTESLVNTGKKPRQALEARRAKEKMAKERAPKEKKEKPKAAERAATSSRASVATVGNGATSGKTAGPSRRKNRKAAVAKVEEKGSQRQRRPSSRASRRPPPRRFTTMWATLRMRAGSPRRMARSAG